MSLIYGSASKTELSNDTDICVFSVKASKTNLAIMCQETLKTLLKKIFNA